MEKVKFGELKTNDTMRLFELSLDWKKLLSYLKKNTYQYPDRVKLQSIHVEESRIVVADGYEIVVVEFREKEKQVLPLGDWKVQFLGSKLAMLEYFPNGFIEWESVFDYKNMDEKSKRRISFPAVKTTELDIFTVFGVTPRLFSRITVTGLENYERDTIKVVVGDRLIMMDFQEHLYNDLGAIHIYAVLMPAIYDRNAQDRDGRMKNGIGMMYSLPAKEPNASNKN